MDSLHIGKNCNEYNDIPVFYCRHCLSLKIRSIPYVRDSDYCDECGSTDVLECHIDEWRELYKKRFGHEFLENY